MMQATHRHAAPPSPPSITVRPIADTERIAAIQRLAIDTSPVTARQIDQFLIDSQAMGLDMSMIWGGFHPGGGLGDVVLVVPQSGRTGMVFASRPTSPARIDDLAHVIRTACEQAPRQRVALAQVLLNPEDDARAAAFQQGGFTRLATLCYMQARVPRRSAEPQPPAGVRWEAWSEERRDAFLAVLDGSYEETLDCPALHGLRATEDVLHGHMATGRFDPRLWTLLRMDDQPAGVMLLNPVPAADCVELVYLGVAARYRGRKLATLLMRRALCQCARAGHRTLTLAVDQSNAPAVNLYRRFRFRRTIRKIAMIRTVGG